MDVRELQIGDWVMYDPNVFIEDEYEPHHKCYAKKIESGDDIDLSIEGCYEPIPLTREILEKLGFELDMAEYPCGGFYQFPKEYKDIVRRGFGVELHEDIFFITDHALMPIRYVHQFQQALRLAGLKDLAENFKL